MMEAKILITAVILFAAQLAHCQECGGDWKRYKDSCYLFRHERIGWRRARQKCIDLISDLVIITSQEENNYVQENIAGRGRAFYWIGLHDTSDESLFQWVDMTYLTATGYSNFRDGEPNDAELPGEDCGEISSDTGKWNDETCVDLNGYVCERSLNDPIKCDANKGWHEYNDRCYWWSGVDREKYEDAELVCKEFGGSLVSIGDETEQNFIQNIQAFEGLPFWLGLTDQYSSKGDFQWDDGETPYNYQNWGPNQPDLSWYDNEGGTCVQIGLNRVSNGNWSTDSCDSKHYFLCEKHPGWCPVGWENFNGFCYQAIKNRKTYTDAKHFCESEGAYLLTILSDAENQFIGENLDSYYRNGNFYMWLGVSDFINDNELVWEHGSALTGIGYTNWNEGEPQFVDGQTDCGSIYTGFADGKWDTTSCFLLKGFYCKAPLGATLNTYHPDNDVGRCEVGWNLYDDSCYFFSQDVLDYESAAASCRAVGAELTSITSPGEQSFITVRIDSIQTNLWIGMNDILTEGRYVWEDGNIFDPATSFTNWAPGEPSPGGFEDCVHLESEYWKLGTWNNIRCTYAHKYICKKDKLPDPPTTLPPTPPPGFEECGEGWQFNEENGRCYFIDPTALMTYSEARLECIQLGAAVGSIHSLAENQYILDMYKAVQESSGVTFRMKLGLDDLNTEGGFQWADGSPLNFLNWNSGEPNNNGDEDCTEMDIYTGAWNDLQCDDQHSFICMGSEYLQTHYNVTRGFGLRYQYQSYYVDVYAEECGRLCEAETSFVCMSFDVDKAYKWCQLYDHTKDDPFYDFVADDDYDHYTREFNVPTEAPPVVLPDTYGCQSGWTPYGNNCYKLIESTDKYDTQRENCQLALDGADLVSITDMKTNNFLNYFIVREEMTYPYIYIGLTDERQEGLYEWVDGSEVTITLWDAGQPQYDPNGRDCTEMNSDTGLWSVVPCSYANYAVCKIPKYDTGSVVIEPTPEGCPDGYMRYYFSCYRIVDDAPLSWNDAVNDCRSRGEQLVVLSSSSENAFAGAQVGLDLEEGLYWTGLSDTETPGYYKFVDGSVPTYVNWAPGQPNDRNGECVAMYSGSETLSGRWTDHPCYNTLPYICEKPSDGATLAPVTTQEPTVPTDEGCADGWYGYANSCFLIVSEHLLSQYSAQTECENMGGHLATFSNPEEEIFLVQRYNALNPDDNSRYWFGLTDLNDEGNWYWIDGTPLVYTNWHTGEPNDYESIEECGEMFFNGHKWNDALCSKLNNYVCERPKNYFIVTTVVPPELQECPSDRTWKSGPPYCYYASPPTGDGLKSWNEANNWCMQNGGYLVSITSSYEAQILRGLVNPAVAAYWIGLRESSTGDFTWVDGQPYSYVNWKPGQPNNQNGEESCAEIDVANGNKWQDKNCGVASPFICKRLDGEVEPISTPTSGPPGGCQEDWYYHSGRCYYLGGIESVDRYDWQNAKTRCMNLQTESGGTGNLATIHSHEEQVFFTSLLKFISVDVWIGMSDLVVDGQYQWTDQYPVTYTNWKPGKPDNTDLNDCVELQNDYDYAGVWSNVRCSNNMGYICQKNSDPDLAEGQVSDFGPCTMEGFSDYRAYGESCFKFVEQPMSYQGAKDNCASEGSILASITDTYEQAFVELTLDINNRNDAWIGLRDANPNVDESEFAWEDEWPLHFTKWGFNEPSQNAGDGCVYTTAMDGWNNTLCSELHRSICKITTAEKPPTDKPVEGECMEGWTDSGVSCYWYDLHATWVSWAEAEYVCNQAGGNLASIHSKADNEFIKDLVGMIGNFGGSVWIGLRKNAQGGYDWTDGTPTDYTHWNNEEPSGSYRDTPEDCVEMYTDDYGKWNDVDCHARVNYVCEMSKVTMTTEGPPVSERATPEAISSGLSPGAISAIVICGVVVSVIIFVAIFLIMSKSRSPAPPPPASQDFPSGFDNMVYKSYDKPTVSDA